MVYDGTGNLARLKLYQDGVLRNMIYGNYTVPATSYA
jgi:hypothetical protein